MIPAELVSASVLEERAADWLQRRRYWKNWSAEDQAALDAWLEESPNNAVAYWRLAGGLNRTERLQALRPRRARTASGFIAALRPALPKLAAAFATAAVLGGGAAVLLNGPQFRNGDTQVYSTGLGGHEVITLADGSQIELNTETTLRADITPKHRYVTLERGEAFFQIVHDEKRPFVVDAGRQRITDLGTQFLARRETGRLEVDLVEGKARVDGANAKSAFLLPGDRVVATATDLSVTKRSQRKLQEQLGWRRGVIVFDNASLADAAAELNRYNQQKIVIVGAGTGQLTLNATLPINNVGLFVRSAQVLFNLQVENRGNEIVISR
jgi:transmembrane sensor